MIIVDSVLVPMLYAPSCMVRDTARLADTHRSVVKHTTQDMPGEDGFDFFFCCQSLFGSLAAGGDKLVHGPKQSLTPVANCRIVLCRCAVPNHRNKSGSYRGK